MIYLKISHFIIILSIHIVCFHGHGVTGGNITVSLQPSPIKMEVKQSGDATLILNESIKERTHIFFTYFMGDSSEINQTVEIVRPLDPIVIYPGLTTYNFTITGVKPGSIFIGINSTSPEFTNLTQPAISINIVYSLPLVIVNSVIGWIYFVAWSISFYPQVYMNWKRKSVIGLNFDFVAYNLTGFTAYGVFNVGLYWINTIQVEYFTLHPHGIIPVQLNDVIFTLHAMFITAVTISQCFIYERGEQRMSRVAIALLTAAWLFAFITLFVAVGHKINWLTYLYFFSYIKLGVTLIKYIPQAWMNYKRKSTFGWSIGNVLLDATGGSFSLLQMFLISFNSDDWGSIFGDPTKFGLGFFSILFDILFIVQHYVLYRADNHGYENIPDSVVQVNHE